MRLTVRPLTLAELAAGPSFGLPFPVLHPLAVPTVARQLGWADEQVDDVVLARAAVVVRGDADVEPGTVVPARDVPALGLEVETATGGAALRFLLARRGVRVDGPAWPILERLRIPIDLLRARWHGLAYLYERVGEQVKLLRARAGAYVVPDLAANLDRAIEALFANGRRGRIWVDDLQPGARPTLSQIPREPDDDPDAPPCTSLSDLLRVTVPGLDVVAAFTGPPVACEVADGTPPGIAEDVLLAVGLHAGAAP